MHRTSFPSKIMLVGEYGVILGGSALSIPFHRFKAVVRSADDIPAGKEEHARQSRAYLEKLFAYIRDLSHDRFHAPPDMDKFSSGLGSYWMDLDIPTGYGLGSSGAVSAAIYALFFPGYEQLGLARQKEDLALIESYFHGKSSGVDALSCLADTALYFEPGGGINALHFDPADIPGGYRFFLIDSGERFETGPLVAHFLDRMKDSGFASSMRNEYLAINQKLIETLLGSREADPAMLLRVISDYQFTHFRKMIPDSVLDLWIEGQVSNEYYLKLNGSGGGFMLGIVHEDSKDSLEDRWKGQIIWIE